jgi:L-alanine-DL-glutamate epimerase-like enolase superfamily enzyme
MKSKSTDIGVLGVELFFLPVKTRMPLKFGSETTSEVTCARAKVRVAGQTGRVAEGWGETPLSVHWVWPSQLSYGDRHDALCQFALRIAREISNFNWRGHPIEIGHAFQEQVLPGLLRQFNQQSQLPEAMPWLAALVCCSMFDLAAHDAYGQLLQLPVFETYNRQFMNHDLASFIEPASPGISFAEKFPQDFLMPRRRDRLAAWHLVGGLDPLTSGDLMGHEPRDGYPVVLEDWIRTDGLTCLKIKLRGNDANWDYQRLAGVGQIGRSGGVGYYSADFNCTALSVDYVAEVLDRLQKDEPALYDQVLYVEQPFPYDLESNPTDVSALSARKPLFLDESAHDWRLVRFGRQLGWSGVALKTCKTLSGALLTACWARAHGMPLMVQDLTNPMLAQIPHLLLAAHVDTVMGVETNCMQFYPQASLPEAAVHPGIYRRSNGQVDLATIQGPGFGYRLSEIHRSLPPAAINTNEDRQYQL